MAEYSIKRSFAFSGPGSRYDVKNETSGKLWSFDTYSKAARFYSKKSGDQMRSLLCNDFLRRNKVTNCSPIEGVEPVFSGNGCECCGSLPTETVPCIGFSPRTQEVISFDDICWPCVCYFANGIDSIDGDILSDRK